VTRKLSIIGNAFAGKRNGLPKMATYIPPRDYPWFHGMRGQTARFLCCSNVTMKLRA
jgi:hypothetical protein